MGMEIEGVAEALKMLERFPFDADDVIKKAMRKTGQAAAKNLKAQNPYPQFRKNVKYTVKSPKLGNTFLNIGFFGSSKSKDMQKDFMKSYWINYGTLANRDRRHRFAERRRSHGAMKKKRIKAMYWRGGINPRRFWEKLLQGAEQKMIKDFEENLNKEAKIFEREQQYS